MTKNQDFDLLKPASHSPHRPRHQVKRSITELSSPIKLPRYHHLHHLQRKDRDNDDHTSMPTSPLLQVPRGSLELPRSEGATPYANSESGLRMTMSNPTYDGSTFNFRPAAVSSLDHEELLREQNEKAASRIAGLRKSLLELSTYSTTTTQRLDDTYYAVLEKLSMLQSTLGALRELAGMSQELNESFKAESEGLVAELEQQTSSFDQLDDQQQRIQELQGRIHTGRDKVEALSKRVDVVRERIENWERADLDWQERTRRRLKVIWIITSIVVFSMVLLFFGAQYAPSSEDISTFTNLATGTSLGKPDSSWVASNQSQSVADTVDDVREALHKRAGDGPAEDVVLRALDEL